MGVEKLAMVDRRPYNTIDSKNLNFDSQNFTLVTLQ